MRWMTTEHLCNTHGAPQSFTCEQTFEFWSWKFHERPEDLERKATHAMPRCCAVCVSFTKNYGGPLVWNDDEWNSNDHLQLCLRHSLSNKKSDPSFLAILARLPYERLSESWYGCMCTPKMCPTLQLLRKIFQNFCGVLEQLSLKDNWQQLSFIEGIN